MNRYCLPIQTPTLNETAELIAADADNTNFFEIWLDYIHDIDVAELETLVNQYPNRIVLLFRRANLETPHMDEGLRHGLLTWAATQHVLVDLDAATQKDDTRYYAGLERGGRLIASHHDYTKTPKDLDSIIKNLRTYSPDIYKIAVFCETEHDGATLIALKDNLNAEGVQSIILGMGEHGKAARLVCDHWGNEIIFAPNSTEHATAPGQFTRQELTQIDAIIERKGR